MKMCRSNFAAHGGPTPSSPSPHLTCGSDSHLRQPKLPLRVAPFSRLSRFTRHGPCTVTFSKAEVILQTSQDAEKVRQRRSRFAQRLPVPNRVRLASSLAAALLGGLFEHPAGAFSSCPRRAGHRSSAVPKWFVRTCLNFLCLTSRA